MTCNSKSFPIQINCLEKIYLRSLSFQFVAEYEVIIKLEMMICIQDETEKERTKRRKQQKKIF